MSPQVLVALDLPTLDDALAVARVVAPHVAGFKVGYELLHGSEPHSVERVCEIGLPVFADAKLHDIPASVGSGARQLGRRGARWVTIHAQGGAAMISAAVEGLAEGSGGVGGVLGVSVLTSIGAEDLQALGIEESMPDRVSRLVRLAASGGAEGIVCAVAEVSSVKETAPAMTTFTPGIRPPGLAGDDQRRVATPASARLAGVDFIVVGRPITRSADPAGAAARIAGDAM